MSNYELKFSTKFKKEFKKISSDKDKLSEVRAVFEILMDFGAEGIPSEMKPHKLTGNWKGHWECHVRPNLLMIWFQIDEPNKVIHLIRIGSHSELFR